MSHDHLGSPLPYPGRVAGSFALPPKGIVLHSSRSGRMLTPAGEPWTVMHEFQSTCNWAKNPANEWGWNITIGPNVWAAHMRATEFGINCGTKASSQYLAVEFSQALLGQPIVQEQVAAFAAMWREYIVPVWPHLVALEAVDRLLLPHHSEMPQGKSDGKSDVYPAGSADTDLFRARIRAALRGGPADEDALLEARWQANKARLGAKLFKAKLTQPYYTGSVLVCERGILTPTTSIDANVVDDWVSYHEGSGTLVRY